MVIKPLLRWLLHSRRRFLSVVLIALAAVIIVTRLLSAVAQVPAVAEAPSAPDSVMAAPPSTSVPVPPPPTGEPPSPDPPPAELDDPSSPRAVAVKFATLWAAPDLPARQWLKRLRPLATEEYGGVLLPQVNPANVPATQVTGPATTISQGPGIASVAVPMDGGLTIRVELVEVGEGVWRVADVQPLAGV